MLFAEEKRHRLPTDRFAAGRPRTGAAAGFSGALFAHYLRVAGPSALEVALSFQVVIWGVFGGLATIYGPVARHNPLTRVGAVAIVLLAVAALIAMLVLGRTRAPPAAEQPTDRAQGSVGQR